MLCPTVGPEATMTVTLPSPRRSGPEDDPTRADAPPAVRRALRLRGEAIDGRWAAAVGGAWVAMFFIEPLLIPAPVDDAPLPWWEVVLGLVWLLLLGTVVAGTLFRRRFGVHASALGVAMTVPLVVACPVTGHHAWAMWWVVDLGLWLAVGLTTLEALRHATPPAPVPDER
jgi:hypothetical protein